jgi:hypothetical protein
MIYFTSFQTTFKITTLSNLHVSIVQEHYHKLSLGLTTKARVCKGASQESTPGVTFHVPRNVRECEGMNPGTFK